jgi:hypothetical protein
MIRLLPGLLVMAALVISGCASDGSATTRPSMDDRANNAINNPMNYTPFAGKSDMSNKDDHLEHRTLQQDLNDVINP